MKNLPIRLFSLPEFYYRTLSATTLVYSSDYNQLIVPANVRSRKMRQTAKASPSVLTRNLSDWWTSAVILRASRSRFADIVARYPFQVEERNVILERQRCRELYSRSRNPILASHQVRSHSLFKDDFNDPLN